ncbi:hypothetical protein ACWEF9_39215, partial [Streptomyces sp. NPDC004980]
MFGLGILDSVALSLDAPDGRPREVRRAQQLAVWQAVYCTGLALVTIPATELLPADALLLRYEGFGQGPVDGVSPDRRPRCPRYAPRGRDAVRGAGRRRRPVGDRDSAAVRRTDPYAFRYGRAEGAHDRRIRAE